MEALKRAENAGDTGHQPRTRILSGNTLFNILSYGYSVMSLHCRGGGGGGGWIVVVVGSLLVLLWESDIVLEEVS